MGIKTQHLNKYYIRQYIINDISFQEWKDNEYSKIKDDNIIIGYLFVNKEFKFVQNTLVFNVYLINRKYYTKGEINLDIIEHDWELFLSNNEKSVFKNTPIECWLDTKDNWCKKMASEVNRTFNIRYDEALSYVYYSIMMAYNRPNVYMGSLNYIKRAIYNTVLKDIRYNKKRINSDNGNTVSLDTIIGEDTDGHELLLSDIIPAESNKDENSLEYEDIYKQVINIMSPSFSKREIDQIINQERPIYLPNGLYCRLMRWRNNHSINELNK